MPPPPALSEQVKVTVGVVFVQVLATYAPPMAVIVGGCKSMTTTLVREAEALTLPVLASTTAMSYVPSVVGDESPWKLSVTDVLTVTFVPPVSPVTWQLVLV